MSGGYDLGVTLRPGRMLWTCVAIALIAAPLAAHHSFAGEFDVSQAVQLKGFVRTVVLLNPHSYVYLDVTNSSGKVEQWKLEGPSIVHIQRNERGSRIVQAGDTFTVCGYAGIRKPAKGPRTLSAALLTLPNGDKRLWENNRVGKCEWDR